MALKIPDSVMDSLAKAGVTLGSEIVAQIVADKLLGKSDQAGALQEIIDKWNAGDKAGARESMIKILPAGFGKTDEMRVCEDLAIMLIDNQISTFELRQIAAFLASLSDDDRRKFRSGYSQQGSERHRFAVLKALAASASDDDRRQYLEGCGFFELNLLEIGVNHLDAEFAGYNAALDARINAAINRRDNPQNNFGVPDLGRWGWVWMVIIVVLILSASVLGNW